MNLGAVLFFVAILVTATVAAPVAVATMVHRRSPAASWMRRHLRGLWATTSLFWLASSVLDLTDGSAHARLEFVLSVLGFLCTAGLALLHHPVGGAEKSPD